VDFAGEGVGHCSLGGAGLHDENRLRRLDCPVAPIAAAEHQRGESGNKRKADCSSESRVAGWHVRTRPDGQLMNRPVWYKYKTG